MTARRRARTTKPLPADAPRPGAAIAGTAAAPVLDPLDPAAAQEAVADTAAAPRRRRRGGRGTGAATVAPESELSELLADASPAEADAVAAAVEVVDAAVEQGTIGQTWGSPVDLDDQPTPAMEDLPVDATPNEVVGAVVDADLEIGTGIAGGAVEPSAPDQPVDVDEPLPEPVPDGSASPDFLLGSPPPRRRSHRWPTRRRRPRAVAVAPPAGRRVRPPPDRRRGGCGRHAFRPRPPHARRTPAARASARSSRPRRRSTAAGAVR